MEVLGGIYIAHETREELAKNAKSTVGEREGKKNAQSLSVNRGSELYIRERSHLAICQADANLRGTSIQESPW